jgi:NADP-dependent 3-hydroxy acid dehydrogenase YdfG
LFHNSNNNDASTEQKALRLDLTSCVINIGSVAGLVAMNSGPVYASTKAALLHQWMSNWACERGLRDTTFASMRFTELAQQE